ncbi:MULTISPECIES: hypothetical protein [Salinibaculum]|uniref:hypothetical protein n=1 Tax=Salinibaculum TaxID=2732368 RepID=UPI0030CCA2E1
MDRRRFLQQTGALGALAVAGCTSAGDDGGGDDGGAGDSPTPTPTATPTPLVVTDQSIETVQSGCGSGAETVSVDTDDGDGVVVIEGRLTTPNPCHVATLKSVAYDADSDTLRVDVGAESTGDVCIECVGAVEYRATVAFDGGTPSTVTVTHRGESVPRGETGERPLLTDASLTVTDVSGSIAQTTADAEFDAAAGTVVVTGTIEGNNGCKTATLGDVSYDPAGDELSVDVQTTDRADVDEDTACTQALVYIDYEATFTFDGGIPGSVSVSHDGRGVMSAGHDSATASAPGS